MPVDNALYDRMADTWWDEGGFLHALTALNPVRFGYMRRVLTEELHLSPATLQVLDIGCGGGLLAEEFARLGCTVTGVDPSEESLAAARTHAASQGLAITYRALGDLLRIDIELEGLTDEVRAHMNVTERGIARAPFAETLRAIKRAG